MQTPVNSLLAPRPYAPSALAFLHTHAQHCAEQQSISPNDRADCAQAFILYLLQRGKLGAALSSLPLANRCAANFARNYRRNRARIMCHETAWKQQTDEAGETTDQDFPQEGQAACAGLMQKEAGKRLDAAMQSLTPTQRELITRHYVDQQSFVELADEAGSTPDAIRMTINRACKRLRVLLREGGVTEEDANEYLAEIDKRGGG